MFEQTKLNIESECILGQLAWLNMESGVVAVEEGVSHSCCVCHRLFMGEALCASAEEQSISSEYQSFKPVCMLEENTKCMDNQHTGCVIIFLFLKLF